jgi:flagellar motor switch protein FliM
MQLQLGDVVKLSNTKVNSDMVLKVGGRKKYKYRPGLSGSRVAVQLGEKIEDIPDELLTSKRSEEEF